MMRPRMFLSVATVAVCISTPIPLHAQWLRQESGTDAEFRGLHAASELVVWAAGRNGWFSRSGDGGATWQADTIAGAADLFLVDVYAFGALAACILGTSFDGGLARIYHTADGGNSWTVTYENRHPQAFLDGLAFWDDAYGVAFGDPVDGAFLVILTTDGCRSWMEVPRENLPVPLDGEAGFAASGTAITVAGASHAWIGTGGGSIARVLRTTDRGLTWTAHETPLPAGRTAGIFGLAFRDERYGIAVGGDYRVRADGRDNVLRTDDGGRTWRVAGTSAPLGVRYGVAYVAGAPSPTLVATGPSGYGLSTDDGTTWTAVDTVSVNTVSFVSPRAGWVAGVEGRIWRIERPF